MVGSRLWPHFESQEVMWWRCGGDSEFEGKKLVAHRAERESRGGRGQCNGAHRLGVCYAIMSR